MVTYVSYLSLTCLCSEIVSGPGPELLINPELCDTMDMSNPLTSFFFQALGNSLYEHSLSRTLFTIPFLFYLNT
jgi:hypothetical protein